MKVFNVTVKGKSPLLMNKPPEYGFEAKWVEKFASKDYEQEALEKLYINEKSEIFTPNTHLERSLTEAGKKLQIKGQGKATYSKPFGSMVEVKPEQIIHKNQDFEVHMGLVVIPSTRGRIARYRPILHDWELSFVVECEEEIDDNVLKQGFEIAGKFCGIGDFRPEKKGKYGKFILTEFKKVK